MAGPAAAVGHNGHGPLHGRDKVGGGHLSYQHFTFFYPAYLRGMDNYLHLTGSRARAGRDTADEYDSFELSRLLCLLGRFYGSYRASLHDVEFAFLFSPLDVLRELVQRLNSLSYLRQGDNILVCQFLLGLIR